MKNSIYNRMNKLLFLPLFILIAFTSCQDEVIEVTNPNEQEILVANSVLATLVQNTTTYDGSFDNIIDYANCIAVNLPVTIIVNGLEITIDSEEDIEVIEAIFDEFDDDEDEVEIIFPISIILNDHTTVTINNFEELQHFVDECNGENEDDDDIECIDFQYPITISVYDLNNQFIETITIISDEQLFHFIDELEGGLLASINFPVTMILADGLPLVVINNAELQAAIQAAEDTCDEDDDNDWDDDDNNDIPIDDLAGLLTHCTWTVDRLEIGDQDLEDEFEGYVFTFNMNGTVVAENNGVLHEGTWELYETNTGVKLNLQMNDLPAFNNEMWLLHELEDDHNRFTIDFRQGVNRLRFEKYECDTNEQDCTEEQVDLYLGECLWRAGYNNSTNFSEYEFYFNENQQLVVQHSVNDQEVNGVWTTTMANTGVILTMDIGAPLADFNGEWLVVECREDRIKVRMDDLFIVFERDCESDNPFDCFEGDAYTLVECDGDVVDGFTQFDLTSAFPNCELPATYTISYHESLSDAQTSANAIENPVEYTNSAAYQQTIYLAITNINTQEIVVFEIVLVVEDCSTDLCSADQVDEFLRECIWNVVNYNGSDDLIVYDLEFNNDGTFTIIGDGQTYTGTWSASEAGSGVILVFSDVNAPNIQAISGSWSIFECNAERLEMHNDNNTVMVMERTCN